MVSLRFSANDALSSFINSIHNDDKSLLQCVSKKRPAWGDISKPIFAALKIKVLILSLSLTACIFKVSPQLRRVFRSGNKRAILLGAQFADKTR